MSNIPTAADSIPALTGSSDIAKKKRFDVGLVFWIFALWIAITVLAAIFASLLGLQDPNQGNYDILNQGPTTAHWFGTDDLGRDIFSRVIYGARVSLTVGFGALTIGMIIGGTLGMIAAYRRGPVDIIVSSASYVMLAFPALVAVIAIVAFWGHEIWKITIIIGVASIPLVFRVVRAATLSYATRDFVTAAKSQGATDWRIITKELFPNVLPAIISFYLIGVASVIILEGALAFLGLSVQPPTASWGNMISESRTYLSQNPWLVLFPSLAMVFFLVALNLIGDILRSTLDVQESQL
ncbi:MAG: ABC transporter permease [Actinomycetes bacterium]